MAIAFTDAAVNRGKELATEKGNPWLRLGIRGGGCSGLSYFMDFVQQPEDKDKQFEFDGLQVCVDRKSYLYLVGTEIDFESTLVRNGFVFNNPAAKRSCSCGESFAL
ncbi:MAG: iron-sulfur cluster assembly accessory protein [Myxococcales bacterium]|nr:iron-sulfur cluster assembly accessory protein [Myxococcales bacterium]